MGKIIRCPECGEVYNNLEKLEDLRDNDGICLVCNGPIEVRDWDRVLASYEDEEELEDVEDDDEDDEDWSDDDEDDEEAAGFDDDDEEDDEDFDDDEDDEEDVEDDDEETY
jgi:hypothetical protein